MEKQKIKDKKLPVGFTFSFPCAQSKLDEVSCSPSPSCSVLAAAEAACENVRLLFAGGVADVDQEVQGQRRGGHGRGAASEQGHQEERREFGLLGLGTLLLLTQLMLQAKLSNRCETGSGNAAAAL